MEREDVETFVLPPAEEAETKEQPRVIITELPSEERGRSFEEVALGYSAEEAMEEAGRCLRCDVEARGE